MTKIPYRITPTSITLMVNGRTHTITKESTVIPFDMLSAALKKQDFDAVAALVNPKTAIVMFTEGKAKVTEDGTVTVDGIELHPVLVDRMHYLIREGYDFKPLARFIANLAENPIKTAVDELFLFMEKNDLAITDDGHFLAYKKVNSAYRDIYSDSIDNSVGCFVSVPESEVDTDRDRTCSRGLHFCSESYLDHYGRDSNGDRVMILKINPKDVRAIPSDYSNAKGRATKYLVIGEVGTAMEELVKTTPVVATSDVEETKDTVSKVGLRNEASVTKVATTFNVAEARKAGYVVGNSVKVLDGKAVLFSTKNPKAVVRSWETKSVKAAVKEAMSTTSVHVATAAKPTTKATFKAPKQEGALFTRAEIMAIFNINSSMDFDAMRLEGKKFVDGGAGMYRIV